MDNTMYMKVIRKQKCLLMLGPCLSSIVCLHLFLNGPDVLNEYSFNDSKNISIVLQQLATSLNGTLNTHNYGENCVKNKTVLLVPFRNRSNNLKLFLSPIHRHLMNQVLTK